MAYASWSVVFGEQPTAAKWNILGTNDASFNDGTGIATGAITTNHLAAGAVTAAKRSQVVTGGVIAGATLGSTGNKAITGIGFTPKVVLFTVIPTTGSTNAGISGSGMMTDSAQFAVSVGAMQTGATTGRYGATNRCIAWINQNAAGVASLECSRVSLDADGFTINVNVASSAFDVGYIAIG